MIPFKVNAEASWCTLDNLNKIQKLASNVTTSYTYEEKISKNNTGSVVFTVKISNLNKSFYLVNTNTEEVYPSMDGELVLNNISANKKLTFQVMANDYGCTDYIMTIYITTPPYNPYYLDKMCEPYEDYKLCSKWINVNISYEEFKKAVANYPKVKEIKEEKNEPILFSEIVVQILLFINKYRLQIIVPIIA